MRTVPLYLNVVRYTILHYFTFLLANAYGGSPLEVMGAIDSSHPFMARGLAGGAEASYFNPALLAYQTPQVSVAFASVFSSFEINLLPRPQGIDIADGIYNARVKTAEGSSQRLTQRPLPTKAIRTQRGSSDPDESNHFLLVGVVKTALENRLALGVYALLPLGALQSQRPFFADEREQYFSNSLHFELYGDRMHTNVIALAIAFRPWRWASLGVGMSITNNAVTRNTIYIADASNQEQAVINSEVDIHTNITPHFGLTIKPWRNLSVNTTVHLSIESRVDGTNKLRFWNFPYPDDQDYILQEFEFMYGTEPLRVGTFVDYTFSLGPASDLAVGLGGTWFNWSSYKNRHVESPAPLFKDTISWSLGIGFDHLAHSLGLDLAFVPTPVPYQDGRTNYVDNTRIGTALSWQLKVPWKSITFAVRLQLQLQKLIERQILKSASAEAPVIDEFPDSIDVETGETIKESQGFQTNNPGYPGYTSSGWLLGGSLTGQIQF